MFRILGKAQPALWVPLVLVVLVVLLAGCDPQRIAELEEGVA